MPHYINQDEDFLAVVNADRGEPWHRLGKRAEQAFTAQEALRLTNMDWDVELLPMVALKGEGDAQQVVHASNKWMVAYPDPHNGNALTALGYVGNRYNPVQNREAFAFMDGIVGSIGGAHYDTAGFLRPPRADGTVMAQVFLTIDLADAGTVVLDPKGAADELQTKLFCMTSHDGSLALTMGESTTRIVCWNTQQMALRGARRMWRMKHTKNIEGRMDEARESMALVLTYVDEMHAAAEKLVRQEFSDKEFNKLINMVWKMPTDLDSERRKAQNVEKVHDDLRFCWKLSPTIENIAGTKWGAYQAVTEYLDWYAPIKERRNADARRATNALVGPSAAKKQRTLQLLGV